jgi:5-formyltetrahydrofolate cyclo-ligase
MPNGDLAPANRPNHDVSGKSATSWQWHSEGAAVWHTRLASGGGRANQRRLRVYNGPAMSLCNCAVGGDNRLPQPRKRSSGILNSNDPQALKKWRTERRVDLIARRIAAIAADHARWSVEIDCHIASLLTNVAAKTIGFCWPYQAEYDARVQVLDCLERGARGALPVVIAPSTPLIFREWTLETKMALGVYDIPVPLDTSQIVPDIILIPLVGFDAEGYRLGYGGGFFDRTLAAMIPRPIIIGVGFELSRLPTIYPQWHDIPVDYVVTEKGLYRRYLNRLTLGAPSLVPL